MAIRPSRISGGGDRRPRFDLVVALFTLGLVGACDSSPRVIAVATSGPYVDAGRMAIAAAATAGPLPAFDTVMTAAGNNLAAPALEEAARLVSVPGMIAVVGHSNSAASLAAAPIYLAHEVVQISPTASAVAYSGAGPYSFRLVPPDDRQGGFIADRLNGIFPEGGSVAVFYVNDDYGRGLRRALMKGVARTGITIVAELPHMEDNIQALDVAHARATLAEARPDGVVWLARGRILDRYLDAIRGVLPEAPILGSDAVHTGGILAPFSARYENVHAVTFLDMKGSARLREFGEAYLDRYGRPATPSEALTYDAVALVLEGLRTGASTGPEMRAYLLSLGGARPPFVGITGPIEFDEGGDVGRSYHLMALGPRHEP